MGKGEGGMYEEIGGRGEEEERSGNIIRFVIVDHHIILTNYNLLRFVASSSSSPSSSQIYSSFGYGFGLKYGREIFQFAKVRLFVSSSLGVYYLMCLHTTLVFVFPMVLY